MLDELTLGTNFRPVQFEDPLKGSRFTSNKASPLGHIIVTETLELAISLGEDSLGGSQEVNIYSSRIGEFEPGQEVSLSEECLRVFNPHFEDSDYFRGDDSERLLHRIYDVHPRGAVLFSTTVLRRNSEDDFTIEEAGFFLQPDYFSAPIPIPEETVIGFTADTDKIILVCMRDDDSMPLLIFNKATGDFKNLTFTDDICAFYGGSLEGAYICGKPDPSLSGEVHPYYANVTSGKMFPIKDMDSFSSLSESGVVVGRKIENDSLSARYMHPSRKYGTLLTHPSTPDLTAISNGTTQVSLGENYHLFTGFGAEMNQEIDYLTGRKFIIYPRCGFMWIASETELREGCDIAAQSIDERLTFKGFSEILRVAHPASNMTMVGQTIDEQFLLVPIES